MGIDDIRRAASIASGVESVFGPARRFLQSTSWWDEGASAKPKEASPPPAFDPLGFGSSTEDAADEDGELLLPQIVIDGETYMYDFEGEYNGIEHVILTLDSEPVGVWNPET